MRIASSPPISGSDSPAGMLTVSNARIQLRLSNPDESQMGTSMELRKAARNTLDRPGFGLTRDGYELLIAVPEVNVRPLEDVTDLVGRPDEVVAAVLMQMMGDLTGRRL